jgi:cell division protein FtsW
MTKPKGQADYGFLSLFVILLIFGLIMLSSASSPVGHDRFADGYFFIKRQLLFGFLPGLAAFLFFAKFSYRKLKTLATPIYGLTLFILFLVFIPGLGTSLNTAAQSWISVGGFSFQPAEFAKLGLIIFYAAYLAMKGSELKELKEGFLVAVGMGMLPVLLVIMQPDIGTVSILFSIVFGMLFAAKTDLSHISLLAAAGVLGLVGLILVAPYRAARLTVFLHPELDPQGIGYQTSQALVAIGSGGLFGLGLGHSRQKFQYLPEVHADSIFAIISEEMGFIAAVGLVVLLGYIAYRGFKIVRSLKDEFAKLLMTGILVWFMAQSFLNIGAMVGVLPLTGVPLPFVSHGGTALIVAMAAVGIMINISKEAEL